MATFNTKKILYGPVSLIPTIADRIREAFENDGFEVKSDPMLSGGYDISISKGNLFKAILGMRSALKVTIVPQDGHIVFEAGVGIFGQQVIPSIISMLFFWPVLLTQIWGMVRQSKLDDKALEIAEQVVYAGQHAPHAVAPEARKFCIRCGKPIPEEARFCQYCGGEL